MQNYNGRFRLPNGKWAHIQVDALADDAKQHISRIRRLWNPPEFFFHLRKGGHVAMLQRHQPNAWYGKLD